jgi:vacuolar-type H+-ATPase subunit B/Vma2
MFLNQKSDENRDFDKSFSIAWDVLSNLSANQLFRIRQKYIDKYYQPKV